MITLLAEPGSLQAGAALTIGEAESHHLRVRRGAPGEAIRLVDGAGVVATARVRSGGAAAQVEVLSVEPPVPAPVPLILAVGAGDRERFGWMVEKAVELGVTRIVPVESERTRGVATRIREGQTDKLARRALEALKQCGSAWAPEIGRPVPLEELLPSCTQPVRWLGAAAGAPPRGSPAGDAAVILIGPEGGWTEAEQGSILAAGFVAVRFGPHVLRFETAALAGAALLQAARQGLRGKD